MSNTHYIRAAIAVVPWTSAMSQSSAITVPDFAQVAGLTSYTLEFWMRASGADGSAYKLNPDVNGNRFQSHLPYQGAFYFDAGDISGGGRVVTGIPAGFVGNWRHVALTNNVERGQMRIYVDGVLQAAGTANLGRNLRTPEAGGLSFQLEQGPLGEVRYWNYVRTVPQLNALRNLALEGPQPGLVACWRMDERGAAGTRVLDRSGNNFHGLIS